MIRATLDNLALLDNKDLVDESRNVVGSFTEQDRSVLGHGVLESGFDLDLAALVVIENGIIDEEDSWFENNCSCDG